MTSPTTKPEAVPAPAAKKAPLTSAPRGAIVALPKTNIA
jgi:hypothetical protein